MVSMLSWLPRLLHAEMRLFLPVSSSNESVPGGSEPVSLEVFGSSMAPGPDRNPSQSVELMSHAGVRCDRCRRRYPTPKRNGVPAYGQSRARFRLQQADHRYLQLRVNFLTSPAQCGSRVQRRHRVPRVLLGKRHCHEPRRLDRRIRIR